MARPNPSALNCATGRNEQCRYARASLKAPDKVVLTVPGADLEVIKLVRFCWADSPVCTLADAANDLPALPFQQAIP